MGHLIPAVGLGTFGSDCISADQVAETVRSAIRSGYRHIDCVSVYGNQKEIRVVINKILSSNQVDRDELWGTSNVWNDMHDQVIESRSVPVKNER